MEHFVHKVRRSRPIGPHSTIDSSQSRAEVPKTIQGRDHVGGSKGPSKEPDISMDSGLGSSAAPYLTFEEVLNVVGSFSKYQMFFVLITLYSTIMWAGNFAFNIFGFLQPTWACAYRDYTSPDSSQIDHIEVIDQESAESCSRLANCTNVIIIQRYFQSLINEWNLVCDRNYIIRVMIVAELLAKCLGSLIGGHLGDSIGRKPFLYASQFGICITSVMSTASRHWISFLVTQCINAFLYGTVEVTSLTLALEMTGGRHRYILNSAFQWSIAYPIIALIAMLSKAWRMYLIMLNLVTSPLLLGYLMIQESPRWLVQKGFLERAAGVLSEIAGSRWNRKRNQRIKASDLATIPRSTRRKYHTCFELLSKSEFRRETCIQLLSMLTCSCVYNIFFFRIPGLSLNVFANVALSGALRIWVPFFVVAADMNISKFTRRFLYLASLGIMIICQAFTIGLSVVQNSQGKLAMTVFSLVGGITSVSAFYMSICQITAEYYPTFIRAAAIGTINSMDHIGGILVQYLILLELYWFGLPFLVVELLSIVTLVVAVLWQAETMGTDMPDTMEQFRIIHSSGR